MHYQFKNNYGLLKIVGYTNNNYVNNLKNQKSIIKYIFLVKQLSHYITSNNTLF